MASRGIPNFRTKEKRVLLFKQVGPVGRKSLTFLYTLKIKEVIPKDQSKILITIQVKGNLTMT